MALKQMEELAGRALADFKIRDVAIVHRLGRLEIGETSVLDCGGLGPSGGGLRRLPLADRYPETHGADLEEGALRRWRGLG